MVMNQKRSISSIPSLSSTRNLISLKTHLEVRHWLHTAKQRVNLRPPLLRDAPPNHQQTLSPNRQRVIPWNCFFPRRTQKERIISRAPSVPKLKHTHSFFLFFTRRDVLQTFCGSTFPLKRFEGGTGTRCDGPPQIYSNKHRETLFSEISAICAVVLGKWGKMCSGAHTKIMEF